MKHLNKGGIIVCHDCLPKTEEMQTRIDSGKEWTGDVWMSIARLRVEAIGVEVRVVDTDYGCALIRKGKNTPYPTKGVDYLSYPYYAKNKRQLMNAVSIYGFWRIYLKADGKLFFSLRIHRLVLSTIKKRVLG